MSDLYRIVYTSKNLLQDSEIDRVAVVAQILRTSKRNNARVGVTGALLFNGTIFAQVLEGPREGVETTFERIQRDPRHSDVAVLACEPVAERGFPNWSMAFVGQSARGRAMWDDIASRTGFDLARIEGGTLFATLHAIVVEEELDRTDAGVAAPTSDARAIPPPSPRSDGLDVAKLRAELAEQSPKPLESVTGSARSRNRADDRVAIEPKIDPVIELRVTRAALDEERQRTTALRNDLDGARIGLALLEQEIGALKRQREAWAGRARALAAALAGENETGAATSDPLSIPDRMDELERPRRAG